MRVGYVLKVFPRLSETFVLNELLAHERAGEEMVVYSLRPGEREVVHRDLHRLTAPVVELPRPRLTLGGLEALLAEAAEALPGWDAANDDARSIGLAELQQAVALAADARARGLDHLHAHFATVATDVARLAAQLAGISYSVTAHAKDIFHRDVAPEALRRRLEDAAAVVTVSEYNVAHLRRACPRAANRIHHVPNGLHLDRFAFRAPRERPRLIAGIGRLVEKKGFEDLVSACALLAERGVDFRCVIVGRGEREQPLCELIGRHALDGRVELLGARPHEDIRRIVAEAAVLAAPCVVGADGNRDGLPTVLLEAMALGTPCVSTDVTGIPEVVRDRETGLQVPQRDPAALAGALALLLDDAELRVTLAAAARTLIEERYHAEHTSAQLRGLFATGSRHADRVLLR